MEGRGAGRVYEVPPVGTVVARVPDSVLMRGGVLCSSANLAVARRVAERAERASDIEAVAFSLVTRRVR